MVRSLPLLEKLAPWAQLAVTVAVGSYLIIFNQPVLALTVWFIGLLFTAGYIVLAAKLKDELGMTRKLSEIVELRESFDVKEVRDVLDAYVKRGPPEFVGVKNEVIQECIGELRKLTHENAIKLKTRDYFVKLDDLLREMRERQIPNERVQAVSVVNEAAWDTPLQLRYLDACIETAKQGVRIDRIFITTKKRLKNPKFQEVLDKHQGNLVRHTAFLDVIEREDSDLVEEYGQGFVMFGKRVLLIDSWTAHNKKQDGEQYEGSGTVSENPKVIDYYNRIFVSLLNLTERQAS